MIDRSSRSPFFARASWALLAIVLIGFAPTFYLREAFGMPSFPPYVLAHGALLTLWFAWFCLQTTSVRFGRVDLHRRLGVVGAALAVPVAFSGVQVALGYGPRQLSVYGAEATDVARVSMVAWGNAGMLAAFVALFSVAVAKRRVADVHRRLMYLSAVGLMPPALARIARNPIRELPEPLIMGGGLAVLIGSLALFDLVRRGRPHRATVLGGGALGAALVVSVGIGLTEPGRRLAFLLA